MAVGLLTLGAAGARLRAFAWETRRPCDAEHRVSEGCKLRQGKRRILVSLKFSAWHVFKVSLSAERDGCFSTQMAWASLRMGGQTLEREMPSGAHSLLSFGITNQALLYTSSWPFRFTRRSISSNPPQRVCFFRKAQCFFLWHLTKCSWQSRQMCHCNGRPLCRGLSSESWLGSVRPGWGGLVLSGNPLTLELVCSGKLPMPVWTQWGFKTHGFCLVFLEGRLCFSFGWISGWQRRREKESLLHTVSIFALCETDTRAFWWPFAFWVGCQ